MGLFNISLCLNPKLTLRTQMMLSIGTTAIVGLGSFIIIGLYTVATSGQKVQDDAFAVVTTLNKNSLSGTAQYVAQSITKKVS